jgi:hypothetical protein
MEERIAALQALLRAEPWMSQFFQIHPDNPQARLIKQAAQIIHGGGIVALPTDSCYALVCHLDDKARWKSCAASAASTTSTT